MQRDDAKDVSLQTLDELVREYADGIADQCTGKWQLCASMRESLSSGNIDEGLAIMREACPVALEDVRLVFRAKKQKFVELLRSGGDPEAALACARAELAPLALDAYPEAYGEFKRLLLLLLLSAPGAAGQEGPGAAGGEAGCGASRGGERAAGGGEGAGGGGGKGSAGGGLLDAASTREFADLAYFTVRGMLGLRPPLLSLLLRFLLRLHTLHPISTTTATNANNNTSNTTGNVVAELAPLLLPDASPAARDPPPLPYVASHVAGGAGGCVQGGGGGGRPSFPEADVQAVIQGAGTGRQAALEALRHAGGDALSAFQAELWRLRLHEPLLAELAAEYGVARGVLSAGQAAALRGAAAGRGPGGGGEGRGEQEAGEGEGGEGEGEAGGRGMEVEGRGEGGGSAEGCDDGGGGTAAARGQELLASLTRLAQEGDAEGLVAAVAAADPGFWAAHPALLFGARRCAFGALLAAGQCGEAVDYARRELSPLASAHPALLPALKAAMAALLPPLPPVNGDAAGGAGATGGGDAAAAAGLPAVAAAVAAVLQPRLGLRPPRLARLMQGLLASHRAWMRAERFSDPFQGPMRIAALRPPASAAAAGMGAGGAAAREGGPQAAPPGLEVPGAGVTNALRDMAGLLRFAQLVHGHAPAMRAADNLAAAREAGLAPTGMEEGEAGAPDLVSTGEEEEEGIDLEYEQMEGGMGMGGGGGMGGLGGPAGGVDEDGVLQLMEVLELPRSAAIALLDSHGGDVQAAVLSVMQ